MKKLFLLVVAVIFAFSLHAQKIGVKAGYTMSGYLINYYSPDGTSMSNGFNAGLVAELDLKIIGIRADVTFQQLGNDYDSRNDEQAFRDAQGYDGIDGVISPYEYEYTQSINYLNVGVSVKKGFGPAYLYVGPYFGYGLVGNQNSVLTPEGFDVQEWTDDIFSPPNDNLDPTQPLSDDNNLGGSDDLYNKIDFGVNLGIGANIAGVFGEVFAGYGLMNFINYDSDYYSQDGYAAKDDMTTALGEDAKSNNIFFGLSVGYMFGF